MSRYITPKITAYDSPALSAVNTGLGNVLFQIAAITGIGRKYNINVEFSSVENFCDKLKAQFGYDHGDTIFRNCKIVPMIMYKIIFETASKCNDGKLLTVIENDKAHNFMIYGYLEHPPYFNDIRNEIIELFSPDTNQYNHVVSRFPELVDKSVTCISIHIRTRADANTKCSMRYYQKAVEYCNRRVVNPYYIVFSDGDVDVSSLNINHKISKDNVDYVDLWAMSLCAHNITCYSTFSWWGAYLNKNSEKIVTYPLSALKFIQRTNHCSDEELHTNYFLSAVQIKDTE